MVENIDGLALRAEHMQLTKHGWVDCLREVTRQKVQQVKQVKDLFAKKIDLVVDAKNYELRCQRILAVDAAKKIVRSSFKTSKNLFNDEVSALRSQYKKMLALVDFFERVVNEQAAVIALQEKVETKLSVKLFAVKFDDGAQAEALNELHREPGFDKRELQAKMKWMSFKETSLYKTGPFEFYGGNYSMSRKDTQKMMRDHIYMTQEVEIDRLREMLESKEAQIDALRDLNTSTEQTHHEILEKYRALQAQNERERREAALRYDEMEEKHRQQRERLKDVIKDLHTRIDHYKDYTDIQLGATQGIVDALESRIDKYKETAKQAKAVLRIPRLCHTYHDRIKHLNDQESSLLLEDLFNEYYDATRQSRKAQEAWAAQEEGARPLSKIEESLVDRSLLSASPRTKRSTERRTQSPHASDFPEKLSSAQYSILVAAKPGEIRAKQGSVDTTVCDSIDHKTSATRNSVKSSAVKNYRPAGKPPQTAGGIGLHGTMHAKQPQIGARTGNNFMRNFGRTGNPRGFSIEDDSMSG